MSSNSQWTELENRHRRLSQRWRQRMKEIERGSGDQEHLGRLWQFLEDEELERLDAQLTELEAQLPDWDEDEETD